MEILSNPSKNIKRALLRFCPKKQEYLGRKEIYGFLPNFFRLFQSKNEEKKPGEIFEQLILRETHDRIKTAHCGYDILKFTGKGRFM